MRSVLFVCMGNCVRSQMAEAILRHRGGKRFKAFSAGAHPAGFVHGMTLQVLEEWRVSTRKLKSKRWDEMLDTKPDAIITLCDKARDEICADWPEPQPGDRDPIFAHWSVPDPIHADVIGLNERLDKFRDARDEIATCIEHLLRAPIRTIDDDQAFAGLLGEIGERITTEYQ